MASPLVRRIVEDCSSSCEADADLQEASVVTVRSVMASERLPELLVGTDRLLLRRWVAADAELLAVAVAESLEHLRPWMPWVAQEPLSLQRRRAMIEEWEQAWLRGGDVVVGAFVGARVAGGCGLHRRIGCGGLEIGYWTHPAFLRTGIATTAVAMLTDAAVAVPGITRVEIHHDRANEASAGIPRTLGYHLIGQVADEPQAPGEVGVECRWRITREQWARPGPEEELGPPHAAAARRPKRQSSRPARTIACAWVLSLGVDAFLAGEVLR